MFWYFLGDTTDNAKGFLISFDNSAVKPKPILKPRKPVKKDDIHESPTVELINHGKEGSVTSDKMERNMDDIPTKMADYSPSGAILKCRLCEESESNDPSLQLCWSCIQLLKRNPRYFQGIFERGAGVVITNKTSYPYTHLVCSSQHKFFTSNTSYKNKTFCDLR